MDLSKFDVVQSANEGFELQLSNPKDGTPLGIYITVLGSDSDEYRKLYAAHSRARLMRARKPQANRLRPEEDFEAEAISILAACTTGWRDGQNKQLDIGGTPLPFSNENAIALYKKFPWIREQVDMAVSDRSNFIKG